MNKRIVLAGVGIAGATFIRKIQPFLRKHPDAELCVVDAQNFSGFIPMLHEAALNIISIDRITFPVRQMLCGPRQHFMQAKVTGLDQAKKILRTDGGDKPYDFLIIANGSRTNFFGVSGAAEHSLPIKTIADADRLRSAILDTVERASRLPPGSERETALHFVIVGGGYTGVEVAGLLAEFFGRDMRKLYPEIKPGEAKITLVHSGDRILPMLHEQSSAAGAKRLEKLGVMLRVKTTVTAVAADTATLSDGTTLASNCVVWSSGVMANGDLLFDAAGLQKGRIPVKATLQLPNDPSIFAMGDVAAVIEGNGPHPQTAQAAAEQAHLAAHNVAAIVAGQPLKGFHYLHKGDLVPIGHGWCVGEIFGWKLTGFIPWVVRRFVYLMGLPNWADRLRVISDWTARRFFVRDTTRL